MISLRPYQEKAIEACRLMMKEGKKRLILCAPTGAGKTVIFSYLVQSALTKGKRVMIVTDRTELLSQAGGALSAYGINPERIDAGADPHLLKSCYTAMIETLNRRMGKIEYLNLLASLDLIIFDEAHKQSFNKLFEFIPKNCVVIGATATPYRDGKQASLDDFYEDIIPVADIPELIHHGFLAKPQSYGVKVDLSAISTRAGDYDLNEMGEQYSKQRVFRGVIQNYNQYTPNKKGIAFCSNIASSIELTYELCQAGINARHLDSAMSQQERAEVLDWFRSTPQAVISNVGILTTGFDEPSIEVIILYRATKSLPLFLQMCGRGSRVIDNKKTFSILDFGNNIKAHGFWEDMRIWSLKKRKKAEGVAPQKECKSCGSLVRSNAIDCEFCGYVFPPTAKEQDDDKIVQLKLLRKDQVMQIAMTEGIREKVMMTKAGLIKARWVLHNLNTMAEAKEFTRLMGYKAGWWYHNQSNFPNLR